MNGQEVKVKDDEFRMKASRFDEIMGRALGAPPKQPDKKSRKKKASKKK